MDMSLFPVSERDVEAGFATVMARFQSLESDASAVFCDLGDADVMEMLLLRATAEPAAELAFSGGSLLGDDGVGTVCGFLSVEAVTRVARLFSGVGFQGVIPWAPEVLSDSRERDREVKPRKYAAAGVRHFWRVEQDDEKGLPVVYVYELDPATQSYGLTGIFHDWLKISVPFDIEIDLTAINRRRTDS